MSAQLDREQINQLISEKRYEEAKSILRQSSDPSAKTWLDNLERQFPPAALPPLSTGGGNYRPGPSSAAGFAPVQERGGCLTIWLVLLIIVNPLLGLYYLGNGSQLSSLLHLPSWTMPVLVIFAVINTVCAVGIWMWKKWGAFGFIGSGIIVFFVNLATLGLNASSIGGVVGIALMWYLLQNRWQMFG
jgi:hypothetical protein